MFFNLKIFYCIAIQFPLKDAFVLILLLVLNMVDHTGIQAGAEQGHTRVGLGLGLGWGWGRGCVGIGVGAGVGVGLEMGWSWVGY